MSSPSAGRRWERLESAVECAQPSAPPIEAVPKGHVSAIVAYCAEGDRSFLIASATAALVAAMLVSARPPFACTRKQSAIDPKESVDSLSPVRVMAWTAAAFCTVRFAEAIGGLSSWTPSDGLRLQGFQALRAFRES